MCGSSSPFILKKAAPTGGPSALISAKPLVLKFSRELGTEFGGSLGLNNVKTIMRVPMDLGGSYATRFCQRPDSNLATKRKESY